MAPRPHAVRLRIGELAERAGVSVATIKFYIRERLLPPPPIKTGQTMGYYDQAYLDRLIVIRTLREEHYLPLRVIRTILAEHGDRPLGPSEASFLARFGPGVLERLEPQRLTAEAAALKREDLLGRYRLRDDELTLLEEMGLIGESTGKKVCYTATDLALLDALARAEHVGLTRDRFPVEGLGHYVELLGELARREVRRFTRQAEGVPPSEVETLALHAVEVSEPIVAIVRRKLLLRAVQKELSRQKKPQQHKRKKKEEP
jgi:DNA-binding transcriptional MerR regulator